MVCHHFDWHPVKGRRERKGGRERREGMIKGREGRGKGRRIKGAKGGGVLAIPILVCFRRRCTYNSMLANEPFFIFAAGIFCALSRCSSMYSISPFKLINKIGNVFIDILAFYKQNPLKPLFYFSVIRN